MRHRVPLLLLLFVLLVSCSHKEQALDVSRNFFVSLSDTTYGKPSDYYVNFDSLDLQIRSDLVEMDESEVTEQNDSFMVRCFNNYTDRKGTFRQDSILLFLAKDSLGALKIYNSQGFVKMDKDLEWFAKATGALKQGKVNDIELKEMCSNLKIMLYTQYLLAKYKLRKQVKIEDWSWETSYDGEAHGEGCVINNMDTAISSIEYHLTYYDRHGNFMAEDDGNISKTLYPGEKYHFTFWSSHAKYPQKANLRLEFSDKILMKMIKSKSYNGNEYQEFVK